MKYVAINGHNHYRFDRIVRLAWSDPLRALLNCQEISILSGRWLRCLRFSRRNATLAICSLLPPRFPFAFGSPFKAIGVITVIKTGVSSE